MTTILPLPLCHGALVCEREGLSVAGYGSLLADLAVIPGQDAKHMGEVIANDAFTPPASTLKAAGGNIARLVQHAEDAGINGELPRFAANLFRRDRRGFRCRGARRDRRSPLDANAA